MYYLYTYLLTHGLTQSIGSQRLDSTYLLALEIPFEFSTFECIECLCKFGLCHRQQGRGSCFQRCGFAMADKEMAEVQVGDLFWLAEAAQVWEKVEVVSIDEDGSTANVRKVGDTKEVEKRIQSLVHRVNKLIGVDDMTALYHLHEPGSLRFQKDPTDNACITAVS